MTAPGSPARHGRSRVGDAATFTVKRDVVLYGAARYAQRAVENTDPATLAGAEVVAERDVGKRKRFIADSLLTAAIQFYVTNLNDDDEVLGRLQEYYEDTVLACKTFLKLKEKELKSLTFSEKMELSHVFIDSNLTVQNLENGDSFYGLSDILPAKVRVDILTKALKLGKYKTISTATANKNLRIAMEKIRKLQEDNSTF